MAEIIEARFPQHLALVRELFAEYAASLDVDLAFQDFSAELDGLPGKYAAPQGCILLALQDGLALGCGAMRPLGGGAAEMKRLYVRPAGRGLRLGRQIAVALCARAAAAGHARIRLDTMPAMQAAQQLYASLGFVPIAPYVFNPVPGTQFLELDLSTWR